MISSKTTAVAMQFPNDQSLQGKNGRDNADVLVVDDSPRAQENLSDNAASEKKGNNGSRKVYMRKGCNMISHLKSLASLPCIERGKRNLLTIFPAALIDQPRRANYRRPLLYPA